MPTKKAKPAPTTRAKKQTAKAAKPRKKTKKKYRATKARISELAKRIKSTNATREARTHDVKRLLITGADRADVVEYTAQQWMLSPRQTTRYLKWAREMIEAEAAARGLATPAWHLASRMAVYKRSFGMNDMPTALRALAEIAKFQGYGAGAADELRQHFDLAGLPDQDKAELFRQAIEGLGLQEFFPLPPKVIN